MFKAGLLAWDSAPTGANANVDTGSYSAAPVTAWAQEFILALPSGPARDDIYSTHQVVWRHAAARLRGRAGGHRVIKGSSLDEMRFVYRVDGPIVRVRISGHRVDRATPAILSVANGSEVSVTVKLALWRDVGQCTNRRAGKDRAMELLASAGLEPLGQLGHSPEGIVLSVAHGSKVPNIKALHSEVPGTKPVAWRDQRIALPTADVCMAMRVRDADAVRSAWLQGVGRGRRFGLGMLSFGQVSLVGGQAGKNGLDVT